MGAAVLTAVRYQQLATGIATLDRPGIRGRALASSILPGSPPAEIFMVTAAEESQNGDPDHYIGDLLLLPLNVAVGPLQMTYKEAVRRGFFTGDIWSYMDYAGPDYEGLTWGWGAQVLRDAWRRGGGDPYRTFLTYVGGSPDSVYPLAVSEARTRVHRLSQLYPNFTT